MSSLPLQIGLLFAVASSQIFGGVSCCCLSRALVAVWTNSSEIGSPTGLEVSIASPTDAPKCPKCAASRASSASSTPKTKGDRSGSLSDDNRCRCAKVAAGAGVQTEPFSLNIAPHALAAMVIVWNVIPAAEVGVTRSYDVPVRFGGHSWQSVACIWKN